MINQNNNTEITKTFLQYSHQMANNMDKWVS